MNIAIDFDGTISAHPNQFRDLMRSLTVGGCFVIVLTAGAGELQKKDRPSEMTKRLAALDITQGLHWTALICCEAVEKGSECKRNAVSFLIDDTSAYMDSVRSESPETVRLLKLV